MSQPNVHKNQSIRANPFVVRKGALSATATPRVESLAQPNRPLSPVKRKPPREKDKYGSPIFPKPVKLWFESRFKIIDAFVSDITTAFCVRCLTLECMRLLILLIDKTTNHALKDNK